MLRRALEGTRGIASNAGKQAGDAFGSEFQKSFNSSMKGVNDRIGGIGKDTAKKYGDALVPEMAKIHDKAFSGMEMAAADSSNRAGKAAKEGYTKSSKGMTDGTKKELDDVEKHSARSGDRAGRSFSDRFQTVASSSIGKSAKAAANSFVLLYSSVAATGTAISLAAGAVSVLVSGLFLLATAAASAASSVIAVGGVLGSLIQGAVAVGIAFKGVFKAIGAGMEEATASTKGASGAAISAARRIADARTRIADVQIRNAQRLADAAERVVDAENKVTRAQQSALDAQSRLNRAREDAQKDLSDLADAVEGAALDERRALLREAEAREALDALKDRGADDIDRIEAQLSWEEAELAARLAIKRHDELAESQGKAKEAGIEGAEGVVDAQNNLIDATNAVAEAENDLAKAREAALAVGADADRDLAAAKLDLARATEDAARAQEASSAGVNKYAEALKGLSPAAREFVGYLVSMKDEFNEFKKAVQEPFFEAFNKPFREMVETLLPIAQEGLAGTASIMGTLAGQFAGALTSNADAFGAALEFNNSILEKFSEKTKTGDSAVGNLVTVLFRLLEAIKPLTSRFADWLVTLTESWALMTDTGKEMDKFTGFFDRAGDRAAAFGDIFGSIFSAIGTAASAAGPAIEKLLTFLSDSFGGIAESAKSNKGALANYFNGVEANLEPLLELMGQLVLVFAGLADDKALGESFEILKGVVEPLKTILGEGANAGPAFARLVVTIVELIAAFAKTDALKVFFETLDKIATVAKNFFESDFGQTLITTLAPALAVFKAFSLVFIGLQFVGNLFLGSILKLVGPIMSVVSWVGAMGGVGAALQGVMMTLSAAFSTFIAPVLVVVAVIAAVVLAFKHLYETSEPFRASVQELIAVFKELWANIVDAIVPALKDVGNGLMDVWEAIRPVIENILEKLIPTLTNVAEFFSIVLPIAIGILRVAFDILITAIVWLLDNILEPVFTTVFGIIGNILLVFTTAVSGAFKWIMKMWEDHGAGAMKTIGNAWNTFLGFFSGPDNIFTKINTAWTNFWSGLWTSVSATWDTVTTNVSNALGSVRDFFTTLGTDISGIWDGIWTGMLDGATSGINRVIRALNRLFVNPLNSLTKAFGLTIPDIPILAADGGYIKGPGGPRDDKIPARLSNGEYVMKAASVKKFGVGTFNALNSGRMPSGGLGDWASDSWEGLKGAGSAFVNLVKEGPTGALKFLFDKALSPMINGLSGESGIIPRLLGGVLQALKSHLTAWGSGKQKEQDADRAAAARGGPIAPYDGPAGGWTYPLSRRVASYTSANHSPYWAYDLGAPVGLGVRAVSAGRVAGSFNKGDKSYGQYLTVIHGDGARSLYAHLSERKVRVGDIVKTGQLIGLSGNSGGSTGPHLHFELTPGSDTREMMRRRGVKLATGGVVRSTPGGVLALLGEGGRNERVEPLNSSGLSRRDIALIDAIARRNELARAGRDRGVTVKVFIGDEELRGIVRYEIQDNQIGLARDLSIGRRR